MGRRRLLLSFLRLFLRFTLLALGCAPFPNILACEVHSFVVGLFIWTCCGVAASVGTCATLIGRASFLFGFFVPSLKTPSLVLGGRGFDILLFEGLGFQLGVLELGLQRLNLTLQFLG